MIPIGRASTSGNLTFKSTATIVAKEGSSMGAGAQKLTTDVTGNDTAGMSVDEHSNTLKTLDEVFEGNRLDYDNTAFKIRSGVDGVSKSVGNADIVYGKITYILDDVDGDILGIYDAKTGVLTQQFVYDSDLGWLLK
ncbi:hypothetical protein DWY38_04855 [Agathobacter rectalis]|uniref:Uncharacterized protein n=2 Tax=Agathobacter rectalis TaxID=39491 RepID=A0A395V4J7_9FIRM|nr:hypothetical protein DWY38_04855 [Agathobacter rectalis]